MQIDQAPQGRAVACDFTEILKYLNKDVTS